MIPQKVPHAISKKVLLAEDSKITQEILQLALEANGHKITTVETMSGALNCLLFEEFDVVFVDYHLPDGTGAELVKKFLAHNGSGNKPRIIALTGDPQEVIESEKTERNFDLILAKPFMITDLVDVVNARESVSQPAKDHETSASNTHHPVVPLLPPEHGYHIIYFPHDFYSTVSNAVSMSIATKGPVDVVVFDHTPKPSEAELITSIKGMGMAMHVDRTGELGYQTDFSADPNFKANTLLDTLKGRAELRKKIRPELYLSKDISTNLMISSYLKGKIYIPSRNVRLRTGASYNHILDVDKFLETLKPLKALGYFEPKEALHLLLCPKCNSARICPDIGDSQFGATSIALLCTDCNLQFRSSSLIQTPMEAYQMTQKAIDFISQPPVANRNH